jgi:uncharacterized membrane protein YqjE
LTADLEQGSAEEPSPAVVPSVPGGPVTGLFKSLTQLLATVIATAQTRLELFTTELQQEIHRAAEILLYAFVALSAAGIGLFLAALVTIFVFWDTHRLLVSVLVTVLFFTIAIIAGLILLAKLRSKQPMLHGTLAELAKDREHLKSRLHR